MNACITFRPDGVGECLYTEVINLSDIGALHVERATTIEFDDAAQFWIVRDNAGQPLFNHPSRQTCLDWEQEHYGEGRHHEEKEQCDSKS